MRLQLLDVLLKPFSLLSRANRLQENNALFFYVLYYRLNVDHLEIASYPVPNTVINMDSYSSNVLRIASCDVVHVH